MLEQQGVNFDVKQRGIEFLSKVWKGTKNFDEWWVYGINKQYVFVGGKHWEWRL